MTKTRRRPADLIRRFPDPDSPGETVTYLVATRLAEMVGVRSSAIYDWANTGHIRATDKISGARNFSVADAVRIRLMTKAERDAKGIILLPQSRLDVNRAWHEQAQDRTLKTADYRGEEWDDYDIDVVIEWTKAGKCIEDIAVKLGRTYGAVAGRIEVLRQSGDIPLAHEIDPEWLERAVAILTPREVASVIKKEEK